MNVKHTRTAELSVCTHGCANCAYVWM